MTDPKITVTYHVVMRKYIKGKSQAEASFFLHRERPICGQQDATEAEEYLKQVMTENHGAGQWLLVSLNRL